MSDHTKPKVDASRRSFLKTAGLASAAGAAAPLIGAPREAEAMRAKPNQRAPRYRESEHVKKYYESNRR
jgi:gas vesicle protein